MPLMDHGFWPSWFWSILPGPLAPPAPPFPLLAPLAHGPTRPPWPPPWLLAPIGPILHPFDHGFKGPSACSATLPSTSPPLPRTPPHSPCSLPLQPPWPPPWLLTQFSIPSPAHSTHSPHGPTRPPWLPPAHPTLHGFSHGSWPPLAQFSIPSTPVTLKGSSACLPPPLAPPPPPAPPVGGIFQVCWDSSTPWPAGGRCWRSPRRTKALALRGERPSRRPRPKLLQIRAGAETMFFKVWGGYRKPKTRRAS